MDMAIKHAKFSASASSKWIGCPASITAEQGYENTSSPAALEGTLAHELADTALKEHRSAKSYIGQTILKQIITEDMAHDVEKYVEYVNNLIEQYPDAIVMNERRVDYSNVAPKGFGTLDCSVISAAARVCHIIDLKFGRGVVVDATNNSQGKLYGLGILNEMGFLDLFDKIVIHIVQPRVGNYSTWEISVEELERWGTDVVMKAVELALSSKPPFNPSEASCRWCLHKQDCVALNTKLEEEVKAYFDFEGDDSKVGVAEQAAKLDDAAKAVVLASKGVVEMFLKAVEESVYDRLLGGGEFSGYKLIEGRSTSKWVENAETVLVERYGNELYATSFVGITAARKIVSKEEMEEFTFKTEGKPKLVHESVKGKPFSDVTFDAIDD